MNDRTGRQLDVLATFASIGTLCCWSVGPIFIKYIAGYLDAWTQNLLRYSTACLFWLPFLFFDIKTKRLERRLWRIAVIPALANIIMQSFWASAFYYIDPAFMNLIIKSSIIWIAGFSIICFPDERGLIKSTRFWLGLLLSTAGVVGVLLFKKDFASTKTATGIIIALSASFMWGVYTVTAKYAFKNVDSRVGFTVISIYTVIGLAFIAFLFGDIQQCLKINTWQWSCVVISGIVSIGFSHVLYYIAIKRIGATIPSLVLLSTPFIVLALSNIVFGEILNVHQLLFGVVLLAGAAMAIWTQQHLKPNS